MNIQLPSGAEEGCLVYALEDFTAWNLPWNVNEGDVRDLQARRATSSWTTRRSAASARSRSGDYREILGRRFKIIGTTTEAASFTTAPIVFMDFGTRRSCSQTPPGQDAATSWSSSRPGADAQRGGRRDPRGACPTTTSTPRTTGRARSRTYWVVSTGLGMNMGVTVFLGSWSGIVVVAQTLYTSAVEHVKEFGTVKAIGGSNWDIYRILGEQALIAAVVGFALGGADLAGHAAR